MNTLNRIRKPTLGLALDRAFVLAYVTIALMPLAADDSQAADWLGDQPVLQRMTIDATYAFAIDYSYSKGIGRALVRIQFVDNRQFNATRLYLFGKGVGIVQPPAEGEPDPRLPERWSIASGTLYATWNLTDIAGYEDAPFALHYPLDAFIVDADGKGMLDGARLRSSENPGKYSTALAPISAAFMGYKDAMEGEDLTRAQPTLSRPAKSVHYDLRALDARQIELYITADGKLRRWLFDGEKWWLKKRYTVEINGPFLVCDNGRNAVAGVDGDWCLLSLLNNDEAPVRHIVAREVGEPLMLIEDTVTMDDFFEQGGKVYNSGGDILGTVPADGDTPTKVTALAELVRSLRQH